MSDETERKGKFFTLATPATHELCRQLVELYHKDMDSAAAKVDIVMAFRDPDGEAPAMEKDGHRILGLASTIKLKDRVKGMGDCEIMLDGDAWDGLPDKQKAALMDHELEHFEVKRDKIGNFVMDDLNRPVIKIRHHDRQFGWFDTIAMRHRSDSMEVHQLRKLFTEEGQVYLPFIKDLADEETAGQIDEALENAGSSIADRTTVSINGGPEIPMKEAGAKLTKLIAKKIRGEA